MKNPDKTARGWAAWGLGLSRFTVNRQGLPDNKVVPALDNRVVPALIEALRDKEAKVRGKAADALSRQAFYAGDAVPELVKCVNDPDDSVRQTAISALRQIGHLQLIVKNTEGVNAALLQALKAENKEVRLAAAMALWHIAQREEAIPVLLQALEDKTPQWRLQEVVRTLRQVGPKAKAAIP